ncbi:sugar transferase [Sulfitobacter pontiacus]|uniref:sugar transferase n=1 Tax=Sulfitobacter pontiacus TaxID=60137 RepID=UPI0036DE71F1
MTILKRTFDLISVGVLAIVLLPVFFIVAVTILIKDGHPVFFVSERMRSPTNGFSLVKFRTMENDTMDGGPSGGHKASKITQTGYFLRRTRLDELPQLWNVLVGDISFVGPRPPLRVYVEKYPDLYAKVLRSRPGITGLASVKFHKHEEILLASATSAEEANEIYSRSCVPRKARLDLIYQRNRNFCFDIQIMLMTVFKMLR